MKLKIGDTIESEFGLETISRISNGMIRGHVMISFASGRWSHIHKSLMK